MRKVAPALAGVGGVLLGAGVSIVYALRAYHAAMPYLLGVAIIAVAVSLRNPSSTRIRLDFSRGDIVALAVLLLIVIPLYTLRVYTTPWQVNTDEVTLIHNSRVMMSGPPADLFGITPYFGCPGAAFLLFGILGQVLGGNDLYHFRLAHGILGVVSVVAAYCLFRQFMRPIVAFSSAVILGANHSLVGYSRMAMWPNTSLLLELIALLLLVRGIQQKSLQSIFLSGVTCGLAFYFYFPGRITIVICALVLVAIWLIGREHNFGSMTKSVAVLGLGCALVAAPVVIATAKNPKLGMQYQREQLLIYPEGRKAAQFWTRTTTPRDAWIKNIKNGLTTFNSRVVDHGWLYPNPGHGFVDPVTGVLVWAGFLAATVRVVRHRRKKSRAPGRRDARLSGDLMAIIGFTTLFLMLAFIVTKAPNYQRLLLILPFVAYFAGDVVWVILDFLRARVRDTAGRFKPGLIFPLVGTAAAALILALNVDAFNDFAKVGRTQGHEVGSTGRFVERRKDEAGHSWILAADKDNLYYFWGEPWWWQGWVGFFAGPDQSVKVVPVPTISELDTPGKTTVFISRIAWQKHATEFIARHAVSRVTNIVPSGRLIAVEVEGPRLP